MNLMGMLKTCISNITRNKRRALFIHIANNISLVERGTKHLLVSQKPLSGKTCRQKTLAAQRNEFITVERLDGLQREIFRSMS